MLSLDIIILQSYLWYQFVIAVSIRLCSMCMRASHTLGVAVTEAVWGTAIWGGLETSANHIEQLLSTLVLCNDQKASAEDTFFCWHSHWKLRRKPRRLQITDTASWDYSAMKVLQMGINTQMMLFGYLVIHNRGTRALTCDQGIYCSIWLELFRTFCP